MIIHNLGPTTSLRPTGLRPAAPGSSAVRGLQADGANSRGGKKRVVKKKKFTPPTVLDDGLFLEPGSIE
jgi:hypothetical protein